MPKTGIIKFTTVKDYITKAKKMRSAKNAVEKLIDGFDAVLEKVIDEAKRLALKADRTTITKDDVAAALDKHLRRQNLPWDETAKEVIKHNPTDLGNISKEIQRWIREHEQPARRMKPGKAAARRRHKPG